MYREPFLNPKAIYAAGGGLAAIAVAIFLVLGTGNLRLPGMQGYVAPATVQDLQLSLENIVVKKTDEGKANVQIVLDVHNPNTSTVTLETIHYFLHVSQFQMTSGDIGASPEGFVTSQPDTFPIVSNSTITLRDTQVAVRNNLTSTSWDSMVGGTAKYKVDGTYTFRLIGSNFQTSFFDNKEFALTFP